MQVKGSSPFNGLTTYHSPFLLFGVDQVQVTGSSPFNGSCDELFLNGEGLIFWNPGMTQSVKMPDA